MGERTIKNRYVDSADIKSQVVGSPASSVPEMLSSETNRDDGISENNSDNLLSDDPGVSKKTITTRRKTQDTGV